MVTVAMSAVTSPARVAVWRTTGLGGGSGVDAIGMLEVGDGRLRFRRLDGIIDFDVPLTDATISFPWYRFGTGAKIAVRGGDSRFFAFSPPRRYHGTMQALEEYFLGPAAGVRTGVLSRIAAGRAARNTLCAALDGAGRTQLA